jgi:hypothetical protein
VSAISPLDPQLFSTIDQYARDLVSGRKNARYNIGEVIQWLEAMVRTSTQSLAGARSGSGTRAKSREFRQTEEDILILNGLGLYYANIFRAALFYSIHEQTGDSAAASLSLTAYRKARNAWADMAKRAESIYSRDISYGDVPIRRGDWADRLPEIDRDLAALGNHFDDDTKQKSSASDAIQAIAKASSRPSIAVEHTVPEGFRQRSDLKLIMTTPASVTESILWYRHVNHGERWLSSPMQRAGNEHTAAIPGNYTSSPYPLQYYFELHTAREAILHPGFNATLSNTPYYAIMPTM